MKHDTHDTEQVYICDGYPVTDTRPAIPCGQLHQESTVAVRETITDGHVSRTMYCRTCNSEALSLCTEAMAVDHGRRVREQVEVETI